MGARKTPEQLRAEAAELELKALRAEKKAGAKSLLTEALRHVKGDNYDFAAHLAEEAMQALRELAQRDGTEGEGK